MATPAFYFAWCDEDDSFDASMLVTDESITEAVFSHSEGDFATLDVTIKNPRVGFLAPGRQRWCYFAYNPNHMGDGPADFDDVIPLFHGRIIGFPPDLLGESCTLSFLARPSDFEEQKAALAETLRVRPYWDPVWFAPDDALDPDNVLEARNALWHIDPVTLEVSISSITTGEDGVVTPDPGTVPYESVSVAIGAAPTRRVDVSLTVNWDQAAKGGIKVLDRVIPTYTGFGLVDKWPEAGKTIGGGWVVGIGSGAIRNDDKGPDQWLWDYNAMLGQDSNYITYDWMSGGKGIAVPAGNKAFYVFAWNFGQHVFCMRKNLIGARIFAEYDVKRGKTENVFFSVSSNTQEVSTDDTDPRVEEMNFSSAEVVSPIDPGGAMPIGRPYARSFLNTGRGSQAIEFTLMCARAHLVASARCVDVGFEVPFRDGMLDAYSLRKSAVIVDYRLPGGEAGGKVKQVSWSISGEGELLYNVLIGASVGRGGEVTEVEGEGVYADPGYMANGYQRVIGQFDIPDSGDIAYESINGAEIVDDGIIFAENTITSKVIALVSVSNTAADQEGFIVPAATPDEVVRELNKNAPTTVRFNLMPLNSGPFVSEWTFATTQLEIAKTIDLEAEADSEP